ncbi:MAG: hypothetical protein K6B65_02220, partial [Bacilli bacterium]|nr:hypothetical protein [Bacilli bacterium]
MKKILLVLSAMLLASCGGGSGASSSQEASKSAEVTSTASSVTSTTSEEKSEESSSSSSSATSDSSVDATVGAWTIDASCLDTTTGSAYLYDYSFNVTSKNNETLRFHGDLIQRNSSKFDVEVVQMKKRQDDSCGYINSEFSMTGTITLSVI